MKLKKICKLFYVDIISDDRLCRYKRLFNFVATKYSIRQENKTVKKYYLFNKLILKRIDIDGDRLWECNKKIIYKESLKKLFKKREPKGIDKIYDDIYFFNSHSGEVYIFLKYILDFCIKKHNSKHPLLVTNQKYQQSIAKIFCPDVPCILADIYIPMHKTTVKFDNRLYTSVVPKWYFKKADDLISSNNPGDYNYFNQLTDLYECDLNNVTPRKAIFSIDAQKRMLDKIKKINLNLDNFVIIIPEAWTCNPIDNSFWIELIKRYKKLGFDVFVNDTKNKIKTDYKYAFLDCEELLALSKLSKRIVALRCGIIEILSEASIKTDILYTGFRDRIFLNAMDVKFVMAGFSLNNFPHLDKSLIREINADNITVDDYEKIFKQLGV